MVIKKSLYFVWDFWMLKMQLHLERWSFHKHLNNKRGALSVFFLITIIIAIAGFIPVLYLIISYLGDTSLGVDEVCKMSVLTRATAPASAQAYVPLKCTTKKICLTQSMFGKCKQFAGEKDVKKVVLPSDAEKAARKIEEVSAQAMYYCWQTMGQGKLDLFGSFTNEIGLSSNTGQATCAICSRIAIDKDSFKEDELKNTLSRVDTNQYMEKNSPPGTNLKYIEIFTNKGARATIKADVDLKQNEAIKQELLNDKSIYDIDYILKNRDKLIDNSYERAYVFSQVKVKDPVSTLANLGDVGITIAGGAAMTPVVGKAVFSPYVLIPGLIVAGTAATYAYINTKVGIEAATTYCGNLQSSVIGDKGVKEGCSVVQAVPYDYKYINSICPSIQGNP